MPALYAHDRFGAEVFRSLDGELEEIISKYYTQYQIGLQGPDIFFFYGAHTNNKVVRFGEHLHEVSAYPFFRHGVKLVQEKGRDSREYAYLLGFLCHFILDSECHPYVEEMIQVTGVQHLEIEEEFEKLLLRIDGRDPLAYPLAELVPTDEVTARTIQPFYPVREEKKPFSGESESQYIPVPVIQRALKDLKWIKKLFTAPQPWKQKLINQIMDATGAGKMLRGVMNQQTDNPNCKETNAELKRKFEDSVELAVQMMENLDAAVQNKITLNTRFDRTFT